MSDRNRISIGSIRDDNEIERWFDEDRYKNIYLNRYDPNLDLDIRSIYSNNSKKLRDITIRHYEQAMQYGNMTNVFKNVNRIFCIEKELYQLKEDLMPDVMRMGYILKITAIPVNKNLDMVWATIELNSFNTYNTDMFEDIWKPTVSKIIRTIVDKLDSPNRHIDNNILYNDILYQLKLTDRG